MSKFATSTSVATIILIIAIGFLILRTKDQAKISDSVTTYTIPVPEEQFDESKQLNSELMQSLAPERKLKLDTPVNKI